MKTTTQQRAVKNTHKGLHFLNAEEKSYKSIKELGKEGLRITQSLINEPLVANDFICIIGGSTNSNGLYQVRESVAGELLLTKIEKYGERVFGLSAADTEQSACMSLLKTPSIPFVIIHGPTKSGKTLLSLAAALELTKTEDEYKKVTFMYPVKTVEELEERKKSAVDNFEYLLSLRNRQKTSVEEELKKTPIQFESLFNVKNRTFCNQIIVIEDAHHATKQMIKDLLLQVGDDVKIILLGDPEQVEVNGSGYYYFNNGLISSIENLKSSRRTGIIRLNKRKTSRLTELATLL